MKYIEQVFADTIHKARMAAIKAAEDAAMIPSLHAEEAVAIVEAALDGLADFRKHAIYAVEKADHYRTQEARNGVEGVKQLTLPGIK